MPVKSEQYDTSRVKIAGSGRISGGTYQSIKVAGSGKIDGDVTAETISIAGSCKVQGHLQAQELSSSGSLKVEGNVTADEFSTKGSSKINGDVDADIFKTSGSNAIDGRLSTRYIKITGSCEVHGDVEADKFTSEGAFQIDGLLSADEISIRLGGDCHAREIGGEKIIVRSNAHIHTGKFRSSQGQDAGGPKRWTFNEFGIGIDIDLERITDMIGQIGEDIGLHVSDYVGGGILETDSIEGDEIYLESTQAKIVRGKRIVIGPGCEIESIEYEESIELDESSTVEQTTRI